MRELHLHIHLEFPTVSHEVDHIASLALVSPASFSREVHFLVGREQGTNCQQRFPHGNHVSLQNLLHSAGLDDIPPTSVVDECRTVLVSWAKSTSRLSDSPRIPLWVFQVQALEAKLRSLHQSRCQPKSISDFRGGASRTRKRRLHLDGIQIDGLDGCIQRTEFNQLQLGQLSLKSRNVSFSSSWPLSHFQSMELSMKMWTWPLALPCFCDIPIVCDPRARNARI